MPGMSSVTAAGKRGALIVLEGCDKAGKTTQSRLLIDALISAGKVAHLINFPDRTTEIGKMLDAYLKCQKEVKDESIHLLFSANRWELVPRIQQLLLSGESVVLDRYAFSGVAFSAAKGTLDLNWCMSPDVGLPQPDKVIYLNLSDGEAAGRGDFGRERYETTEFQRKVKKVFFELKDKDDSYWTVVESHRSKEDVHQEILTLVLETIGKSEEAPIFPLWKNICSLSPTKKQGQQQQQIIETKTKASSIAGMHTTV